MPSLNNGTTHKDYGHDIPNIHLASSVRDIQSALAQLSTRETTITARLDSLIVTQKDLNRQLARLDLARAQLGAHVIAARAISTGLLSNASRSASRISGAVRKLDREQAAVKATLDVVEQVAELKACVLGVHGSMGAPQDWEQAAAYLHRAASIPAAVIDGAFAEDIVPTTEVPDPPRHTLNQAAESLCALFLREFSKAVRDGDGGKVTLFFKLFPLIGRSDVGLDAYGRYVCSGIATRAHANLSSSQQQQQRGSGVFYANALTKLFEHIAQIVDGHAPLVERHYGPGSMVKVIERIQAEADVQGGLILDSWAEERRVGRRLMEVKSYPFNFLVQSFLPVQKAMLGSTPRSGSPAPASGRVSEDDGGGVDMKEVDALLNEGAAMLGRWALYTRFLASKTQTHPPDISALDDDNNNDSLTFPAFLAHSTLAIKVSDHLTTPFNTLATFFVRRSVERSFQLDEPPPNLSLNPNKPLPTNPPFITTAVDDVMYIVSQTLQRALSTSQRAVVASVLPSVGRVLGGDFFGVIQRRMKNETYPKPAIQGALPPEGLIVGFVVLMNNLDVATEYVHRIVRTHLDQPTQSQQNEDEASRSSGRASAALAEAFPFGNDALFVEKALRNLTSAFEAKTADLLREATDVLLAQVVRPRLRPVLVETFRDISYLLPSSTDPANEREEVAHHNGYDDDDDDDGDENETALPPVPEGLVPQRFERGWQAFTLPLKRLLMPGNFDRLLAATCTTLARALEKRVFALQGRVNALGAIRLERDLAGIVAAAVKGGRYEVRGVFKRLGQMGEVLGMEDEEWEELLALGGEAGEGWELNLEERKRVRGVVRGRAV